METKTRIVRTERAVRIDYTIMSALDEEVGEVSYPYLEKEYDTVGNLIREISYDHAGSVQEHYEYLYDDQGRRIESKNFYDEEEVVEVVHYTYEVSDRPVSAMKVYADGSEEVISFGYDDQGRLVSKTIVNDEGEEEESEVWRYDGDREVFYEKCEYGEPVFREGQEYDDAGRVVRVMLWEDPDGTVTENILRYDDTGRRNLIEKKDGSGRTTSVIRINAFDGDEPAEITESDAGGTSITKYSYNADGRPVLQQEFSPDGSLVNELVRTYTPDGLLQTTEVTTDRRGAGMNLHYRIEYEYQYFD
jgi:hypothetical protein